MEETTALERRLSELPEELNLHILSYYVDQLSDRQAIPLSLLSKQVHRIVQNRPSLVFDFHPMQLEFEEEFNYIQSVLQRQDIQLKTFSLTGVPSQMVKMGLCDRFIEMASKKYLRNLNLRMSFWGYVLPQFVFQLESLVELSLDWCSLKPESIVAWPNLKRLSIGKNVGGTHEVFENIIKGCPSIEYLNFNSHSFTADLKFKVANLRSLKQLYFGLGHCKHRLEVNAASNLESIQIMHDVDRPLHYNVIDFGRNEYPRLRSIEVTSKVLDEKFFTNFALRFPVLEKLSICNTSLKKIDLSSASLKEIKLISNRVLEEAIMDVPELVHFEYKKFIDPNCKLTPKLTVAGNSGRRWSSCIKLADNGHVGTSWFLKLNEFLASLKGSETSVTVKFLSATFKECPVIANHVIPVRGIREFSLDANSNITKTLASAILDCIFSICQPQTITFLDGEDSDFPMLLREKLVSRSSHHYHGVTDFQVSQRCVEEPLMSREKKNISFHLEYSFESTPKKLRICRRY